MYIQFLSIQTPLFRTATTCTACSRKVYALYASHHPFLTFMYDGLMSKRSRKVYPAEIFGPKGEQNGGCGLPVVEALAGWSPVNLCCC